MHSTAKCPHYWEMNPFGMSSQLVRCVLLLLDTFAVTRFISTPSILQGISLIMALIMGLGLDPSHTHSALSFFHMRV